jgi:hypothetical protein
MKALMKIPQARMVPVDMAESGRSHNPFFRMCALLSSFIAGTHNPAWSRYSCPFYRGEN